MRPAAVMLMACAAAATGGCGRAPGYPPNPMARPQQITDFVTLYKQNCAACHGVNGEDGPAIDLANPEYEALVDDNTLRKWTSDGMPGTLMPAFAQSAGGMLTEAQVNALVAGIRRQWQRPNAYGGATPPPYAQTQAGDARRGQSTYQARCAGCHEASGEQISSPAYLALVSDQSLRTVTIAGRPDIGQPDWRHDGPGGKAATPLSAQEVDDIVAYLSSLRKATQQVATVAGKPAAAPHGR